MVEYILGNYLVESNKISSENLNAVLEQMNAVRVKLGLIAVEQGYLTNEQVGKLLQEQGNTYFMFVQTLVDLELLEMDEVDGILDEFKKIKGYTNTELEDIKSDDVDRIIPLYLTADTKKYQELAGVAIRTIIRLIDRRVYIGEATIVKDAKFKAMVSQKLQGENSLTVALAEKNGALLELCGIFGQEVFESLDEDALDAAGEFINCLNGLYASARSRAGEFLELFPPEYCIEGAALSGDVCVIPVFIQGKELYFVVA